jgi:hypothetical protein
VQTGRQEEAADVALQLLGLADAVAMGHPSLLGHLVGVGIDALAADAPQDAAPHWRFGDGGLSPETAERLIGALLDSIDDADSWRAAVDGESVFHQNTIDHVFAGGDLFPLGGESGPRDEFWERQLRRTATASGVASARLFLAAQWLMNVDHPDVELVDDARLHDRPDLTALRNFSLHVGELADSFSLAAVLLPSYERTISVSLIGRNEQHLAAVGLAAAWYRHDHGELPPTLAALVPDYLPTVPPDVLTPDGHVRYDRERGIAWATGPEGEDTVVKLTRP